MLEIVHKDSLIQKSLASSIQAQYNGFLAGASANFSLSEQEKTQLSESSFRILQYQASGQGVETSLTNDEGEVLQRLKEFPSVVLSHPVAIQVELATYDTVPTLQVNLERRAALESALEDAAQKALSYKNIINDCSFFLQGANRGYFRNPPPVQAVQGWKTTYTKLVNDVTRHAIALADETTTDFFVEPADLPIPTFTRLPPAVGAPVNVPSVIALDVSTAMQELKQLGLNPIAISRTIPDQDLDTAVNVVLQQSPAPSTPAKKGDSVTLSYAVRASRLKYVTSIKDLHELEQGIRNAPLVHH